MRLNEVKNKMHDNSSIIIINEIRVRIIIIMVISFLQRQFKCDCVFFETNYSNNFSSEQN